MSPPECLEEWGDDRMEPIAMTPALGSGLHCLRAPRTEAVPHRPVTAPDRSVSPYLVPLKPNSESGSAEPAPGAGRISELSLAEESPTAQRPVPE